MVYNIIYQVLILFFSWRNIMTDQFQSNPEVTSDDRLWGLLSYLLTPIIPIIILVSEDKKSRAFQKFHGINALALGVVEIVLITLLALIPIVGCFTPLVFIINILYALKANKGELVEIPVITNFCKNQGWI